MKRTFAFAVNYIRNHFFSSLVVLALCWLVFFDGHSVLAIHRLNSQADDMRKEIQEFRDMVEGYKEDIERVSGDSEQMEHFAREQLHMKKPNEDVFLIEK